MRKSRPASGTKSFVNDAARRASTSKMLFAAAIRLIFRSRPNGRHVAEALTIVKLSVLVSKLATRFCAALHSTSPRSSQMIALQLQTRRTGATAECAARGRHCANRGADIIRDAIWRPNRIRQYGRAGHWPLPRCPKCGLCAENIGIPAGRPGSRRLRLQKYSCQNDWHISVRLPSRRVLPSIRA